MAYRKNIAAFVLPGSGREVQPAMYPLTGTKNSLVRSGFTEWDDWGHVEGLRQGLACATTGYCIDAPEQLVSGASKAAVHDGVLHVFPTYATR